MGEKGENIIVLHDEANNEVSFEFLDLIPYRSKEYVVLLPLSSDAAEVVILQLEEVDSENENYVCVDSQSTLQSVFELFKERNKDNFTFLD